jgi:hypothetical protein
MTGSEDEYVPESESDLMSESDAASAHEDAESEHEDAASTTSTRSAPSGGRKRGRGGGGDEPDNDYDAYQLLVRKEYCKRAVTPHGAILLRFLGGGGAPCPPPPPYKKPE